MSDAAKRRLLDRLRPDTSRTGRVRRVLCTTHNLDADFFDSDFLCTALSVAQADFEGHSGQLALQRKLAGLDYAGVLCEARAYADRPSLRTVVYPIGVRGACLHAKLVVLEYEHAVRILVGSANLTPAGYRENREVCGELLAHREEPKKVGQAVAVLRSARGVLSAFSERAPEFLDELAVVISRLESWAPAAGETSPVVWSDGEHVLWRAFLGRWPEGARVERVRIVSPFWCEDGTSDTPLRRLLGELRDRQTLGERCDVELFVESTPLAGGGFAPLQPLNVFFADFPGISVRVFPTDPTVAASDLDVKLDLTKGRRLHAKVLVLESREHVLAYAGSANFTRNGYGLRHGTESVTANVEAGWVFELPRAGVTGLLPPAAGSGTLLPSLAAPRDVAGPDDGGEDKPKFWPHALLAAELTPSQGAEALDLTTRWSAATPSGWTVHVDEGEDQRGPALFTTSQGASTVTTALTPELLKAILRRRHIVIVAPEGVALFPVNVAAGEARYRLPISPAGTKPGESELLAYYQGRITLDDLYPEVDAPPGDEANGAGNGRSETVVDKSRIQAYQIRAFVDALPGMQRELLATRGTAGALFQAFRGEVSPVALAKQVVEQVNKGRRSGTAGAFQLTELVAMLRSVAAQAPDVEHFGKTCSEARVEIEQLLETLRKSHADELGPSSSFARYAASLGEAGA